MTHFGAKEALEKLDFGKTGYKHLVLARSEFLEIVGAPNESLRLIILNYMFKYQKNFAWVTSEPKKPFKGLISAKQLIITCFSAKQVFNEYWSSKWVPKTYYIILYVQIHILDKNNFSKVTSEQKKNPLKARFRHNLSKGLSFCA